MLAIAVRRWGDKYSNLLGMDDEHSGGNRRCAHLRQELAIFVKLQRQSG